jgi:hypothetical protein
MLTVTADIFISPLFYKKGTAHKTSVLQEKQKTHFKKHSFLLQMNYLTCRSDNDNIILIDQIINVQ